MRDWRTVLDEHAAVAARLAGEGPLLVGIADAIVAAIRGGGRVYLLGNGGSAADAQHIAAELIGRYRRERRALPAIALSTDTSTLTAVGNDSGFERVFARQVEALVRPGDVVWALSTSGASPNVLAALRAARERGAACVGFTGESGGGMRELCGLLLRVPHAHADRVQEAHAVAYHFVCERVEAAFA